MYVCMYIAVIYRPSLYNYLVTKYWHFIVTYTVTYTDNVQWIQHIVSTIKVLHMDL